MTRYLSGLCVAGLGLCGGGWLVAAVAFGGESAGLAGRVNLMTGAGLIAVCCLSLVCWSLAWRQRMRVDGVLTGRLLLVSRHEARRNRRALGRDVRRAGKLAGRSARDARRSARRAARAGGGMLGGVGSEGGVRSAGAGLGSASAADQRSNVAVSHRTNANGVNGSNGNGYGATRSGGTSVNGFSANGHGVNGHGVSGHNVNGHNVNGQGLNGLSANGSPRTANGPAGAGQSGSTGDAAELIGQLREMLVPLLAATESQPAHGGPTGASQPGASQPGASQAGASGLPRRTPSASEFRPRATIPMPRLEPGPAPVPQVPIRQVPPMRMPLRQRSMHPYPLSAPAAGDDGLGVPVDSEEAWW